MSDERTKFEPQLSLNDVFNQYQALNVIVSKHNGMHNFGADSGFKRLRMFGITGNEGELVHGTLHLTLNNLQDSTGMASLKQVVGRQEITLKEVIIEVFPGISAENPDPEQRRIILAINGFSPNGDLVNMSTEHDDMGENAVVLSSEIITAIKMQIEKEKLEKASQIVQITPEAPKNSTNIILAPIQGNIIKKPDSESPFRKQAISRWSSNVTKMLYRFHDGNVFGEVTDLNRKQVKTISRENPLWRWINHDQQSSTIQVLVGKRLQKWGINDPVLTIVTGRKRVNSEEFRRQLYDSLQYFHLAPSNGDPESAVSANIRKYADDELDVDLREIAGIFINQGNHGPKNMGVAEVHFLLDVENGWQEKADGRIGWALMYESFGQFMATRYLTRVPVVTTRFPNTVRLAAESEYVATLPIKEPLSKQGEEIRRIFKQSIIQVFEGTAMKMKLDEQLYAYERMKRQNSDY